MAEKTFWSYIRVNMKGKWSHATRVENSVSLGMADVTYYHNGNGWIELKEVKQLPKRATTGIKLGQWHKNGGAQRHFLIKRRGWLFVRVNYPKRTYLLFDWANLPPWSTAWTWAEFLRNACRVWEGKINFEELEQLLDGGEL